MKKGEGGITKKVRDAVTLQTLFWSQWRNIGVIRFKSNSILLAVFYKKDRDICVIFKILYYFLSCLKILGHNYGSYKDFLA